MKSRKKSRKKSRMKNRMKSRIDSGHVSSRYAIFSILALFVCSLASTLPSYLHAQTKPENIDGAKRRSRHKGVGLAESKGMGVRQLEALKVGWYYNWNDHTSLTTDAQFIPMLFSAKRLTDKTYGDYLLGYNEPDHPKQANLPVEEALATWTKVATKAKYIGSPAMASNPVTGQWFPAFMAGKPKVDFITVHWYKGVDSQRFIADMEKIHDTYKKPLWITEFAPQTAASSKEKPDKYTQAQVDRFITEVVDWMESTPWVERYAWHDSKTGTSALFDEQGNLTSTGKAYAAAK